MEDTNQLVCVRNYLCVTPTITIIADGIWPYSYTNFMNNSLQLAVPCAANGAAHATAITIGVDKGRLTLTHGSCSTAATKTSTIELDSDIRVYQYF
jgi:hypothetical protein